MISTYSERMQPETLAPRNDRAKQDVVNQGWRASIMVVDDQPANLRLMETMLSLQGYNVRSFPRGRMALAAASELPPDLILLDINMPEMNGFEVCEQLKANKRLAAIPVIFLSALNETEDKVRAFRCGGVDYITKPFQCEEVQARVETHVSVYSLQRDLRLHTDHLEELVQSRTRELTESQARLQVLDKAKSAFLQLISHEFRTPLNGLLGIGEILLETSGAGEGRLRDLFEESRHRITAILDDAMLLTQIDVEKERFKPGSIALASIVNAAILGAAGFAETRTVTISAARIDAGSVTGDEGLLTKAIEALLETAVRFASKGQAVTLFCEPAADSVKVTIESSGRSIPEAALSRFFDLFSISESITADGDIGLGPPVASRILSLFGGWVTVENRQPAGIRIQVTFKRS